MKKVQSPWIHQLNKDRTVHNLSSEVHADVIIVGAGIAGISTAFFLLKHTKLSVAILEGYKLAHGATGHNAGQVSSYFERPFHDIVKEFGLDLAVEGQQAVESAWQLLDEMYTEAGLEIPFSRFSGHLGLSRFDQVITHLKNNVERKRGGLNIELFCIADNASFLKDIPLEFSGLYHVLSHEEVLARLETENKEYLAVITYQKGCINSALFTEEVALYLLSKYQGRCALYEHASVKKVILESRGVVLDVDTTIAKSKHVVLCTNGFQDLTIIDHAGLTIDTSFHHHISGTVGYMSGYLEKYNKPPTAISYFGQNPIQAENDPYFYLTRRPFELEKGINHNLICIGGPDISLEERALYTREGEFPEEAEKEINDFVKTTYDIDPNKKIEYQFTWHGLMGYTPNRIRLIGAEVRNKHLLYNLGCNGVGILPSIYGGLRISEILSDKKLPKSIFDPQ